MIKCGRCGNPNAGDVLFCQYCGTRLVEQRLPDVAGRRAAAPPASNRSTDRLIEQTRPAQHPRPCGARAPPAPPACRPDGRGGPGRASQQTGFRLVVVHRDGTDGITYNLLGDQIDIGRTEGDLLFEDPAPGAPPRPHRRPA